MPDQVLEPSEKRLIPTRQIKLVPAIGIAGFVAAGPWTDETPGRRVEGVVGDIEVAASFNIGAGPQPGAVQFVFRDRLEISPLVEIEVQCGTVMFA